MPSNYPLLRSLTKDAQTEVEAVVKGSIPNWLNGALLRNGPGRYTYIIILLIQICTNFEII